MALSDVKRDRIRRHIERAQRLRQKDRRRPPAPVVIVAVLDFIAALCLFVGLGILIGGRVLSSRAIDADRLLQYVLFAGFAWSVLLVARGILRGARSARWVHVLIATYQILSIATIVCTKGSHRVADGAVRDLCFHALLLGLLFSPSANVWFQRSVSHARLPGSRRPTAGAPRPRAGLQT